MQATTESCRAVALGPRGVGEQASKEWGETGSGKERLASCRPKQSLQEHGTHKARGQGPACTGGKKGAFLSCGWMGVTGEVT